MNDPMVISMVVGVGVIALIGGLFFVMTKRGDPASLAAQRLDGLNLKPLAKGKPDLASGILLRPPAINQKQLASLLGMLPNLDSLNTLYEQADVNLPFNRFMAIVAGLAAMGAVVGFVFKLPVWLLPLGSVLLGTTPFFWLLHRKRVRVKKFLDGMPQAVELISRGLRAGHSLASAMHLVAEEMKGPVAVEFGRVFEEQNLGVPLELALRAMAERIPLVDVRFFVTAVIIQRATGGDLAEVLDKIGRLIRQRFELAGHVKSLTAEGRLSGIVLLALSPGLLAFLSFSNYGYVSVLFNTPTGTKMLAITAGLQILGALMIKKIIAIKV
jgi:tight adherence protein B